MTTDHGTHSDLHSEQGALRGEHPGRAKNPLIKVVDLAWLEFEKPDLAATAQFAAAFGFTPAAQTADERSHGGPSRTSADKHRWGGGRLDRPQRRPGPRGG